MAALETALAWQQFGWNDSLLYALAWIPTASAGAAWASGELSAGRSLRSLLAGVGGLVLAGVCTIAPMLLLVLVGAYGAAQVAVVLVGIAFMTGPLGAAAGYRLISARPPRSAR